MNMALDHQMIFSVIAAEAIVPTFVQASGSWVRTLVARGLGSNPSCQWQWFTRAGTLRRFLIRR